MLRYRLLGPVPRVSDPADLEWGVRICISNKLPRDGKQLHQDHI